MRTQRTSRILMAAAFLATVMIGASLAAQTAPRVPMGNSPQQTQQNRGAQNHAAVERNQSCQRILSECRNLGFIQGEWKQDNGLWKDCFDPVVHGGQATRDGKSINVPVSSADIQACRGATGQRNQGANKPPVR